MVQRVHKVRQITCTINLACLMVETLDRVRNLNTNHGRKNTANRTSMDAGLRVGTYHIIHEPF